MNIFYRLAKPFGSSLFVVVVGWGAFAIGGEVGIKHEILMAHQDDAASLCQISGPMGPWDHYQTRDLPNGDCSGAQACTIWTKDLLPRNDQPRSGD